MTSHSGGRQAPPVRWLPSRRRVGRLDRSVVWSLFLFLLSFPLMLLFLALIAWAADVLGVEFGSDTQLRTQGILNAVYVGLVLLILGVAMTIGLVGWFRRRQPVALVVAVLSGLTALAFVAFPSLV